MVDSNSNTIVGDLVGALGFGSERNDCAARTFTILNHDVPREAKRQLCPEITSRHWQGKPGQCLEIIEDFRSSMGPRLYRF